MITRRAVYLGTVDHTAFEAESVARYSDDMTHRYSLARRWDPARAPLVAIGLNPSTATETMDDPTIAKLVRMAYRAEAGGLVMLNLFSLRSTDPRALYRGDAPLLTEEGKLEFRLAVTAAEASDCTILMAWGAHGALFDRGAEVVRYVTNDSSTNVVALGVTKNGQPKHPLYLKDSTPMVPWALFVEAGRAVA